MFPQFYNAGEAAKYTSNTRVQSIQAEMTFRCLELLDLPAAELPQPARMQDDEDSDDEEEEDEEHVRARPSYLLDIGAGSGLSGEILTEEGHQWVGMDVSGGMLGAYTGELRTHSESN